MTNLDALKTNLTPARRDLINLEVGRMGTRNAKNILKVARKCDMSTEEVMYIFGVGRGFASFASGKE